MAAPNKRTAPDKDKKSSKTSKVEPPHAVLRDIREFTCLERFTCDICGQEGLTDVDMRSHVLLEHVDSQISCPFCDLEGTTLEEMNLHVNSQHLDILTPEGIPEQKGEPMSISASSSDNDGTTSSGSRSSPTTNGRVVLDECGNIQQGSVELPESLTCDRNHRSSNLQVPGAKPLNPSTPKRAKLYLEVPRITPDRNTSSSGDDRMSGITGDCVRKPSDESETVVKSPSYSCPLCGWGSDLAEDMTKHVNVAHLDAMTPTKLSGGESIAGRDGGGATECPLCGWVASSSSALELHVNQVHAEELGSPVDAVSGVGSLESPALACPVCGVDCQDTEGLTRHVNGHFSDQLTPGSDETCDNLLAQELDKEQREAAQRQEQREFKQLQEKYGMAGNNNYKKQAEAAMTRDMYNGQMSITDYYVQRQQILEADTSGIDDGHSCTKGIVDSLHRYYEITPGGVVRYNLCSSLDHFAASHGDKGWGCGYRNLQMLLSSLASDETYQQVLFNGRPLVPSIPKIQRLIEAAWQKGFDRAGCEQLGGKVVNTSKWIGATEIVATLSSLNVKCQLVDFHTPTGNGGTHPRLFEWVKNYFQGKEAFQPPLYLQHQGHSRTIIGVEQLKDGSTRLLLFDPSCRKPQMCQFLRDINANLMRTLRRPIHTLKAKQYQIVAVRGILTDNEYQDSKMLKSEQVP